MILQFATDTPQRLLGRAPPYSTPDLHITTQQNRVRNASNLSKPLRFVSSQWRSLLDPIFWSSVSVNNRHRFGSTTKLRSLQDALETSARNDPYGGVGRFIQEITFNTQYLSLPDLGRIVQCCTRLRDFGLDVYNDWNEDTIPDHLTLPSSLRRLHYYKHSGNKPPFPKELAHTLSSNVTWLYLSNGYMGNFPRQLSFSRLETLQIKHFSLEQCAHIATWEMPSLARLTFVGSVDASTNPVCQRFGPQLSFLELSSSWNEGWSSVLNSIQPMRKLEQLVLPSSTFDRELAYPNNGENTAPLPPITHLELCGWSPSGMMVPRILERFLRSQWPALRCIRFIAYGPDDNPQWPDMQGLRLRCVEVGIEVEDRFRRNVFEL